MTRQRIVNDLFSLIGLLEIAPLTKCLKVIVFTRTAFRYRNNMIYMEIFIVTAINAFAFVSSENPFALLLCYWFMVVFVPLAVWRRDFGRGFHVMRVLMLMPVVDLNIFRSIDFIEKYEFPFR